jgi:Co/Zn/Cd efflux system component
MLVDALSYLGNLAAECNPDLNSKKAVELGVSGVSIALLLGFTVIFLYEGVTEVSSSENDGSGDDVDPRFVMAFSLFGLVVDGVSLWSFAFCSDDGTHGHGSAIISHSPDNEWKVVGRLVGELGLNRGGEQIEESAESEGDHATSTTTLPDEAVCEGHVALENPLETIKMAEGVVGAEASGDFAEGHAMSNLNMLSALMHVGSDLLRSTTTLVEAVIIMRHPELDSGQVK